MNILRTAKDDIDLIIDEYMNTVIKKIKNFDDHFSMKGKNIEVLNVEQASYLAYYDEIRVELKAIKSKYESKLKKAKAIAWEAINTHSRKDHSDREKEILVVNNKSYEDVNNKYLEICELYDTLDSICTLFKDRAYSINNIVKIRIAGLEGISVYE